MIVKTISVQNEYDINEAADVLCLSVSLATDATTQLRKSVNITSPETSAGFSPEDVSTALRSLADEIDKLAGKGHA